MALPVFVSEEAAGKSPQKCEQINDLDTTVNADNVLAAANKVMGVSYFIKKHLPI